MGFTRRDLLKTTAGASAGLVMPAVVGSSARAQDLSFKPDEGAWLANTKKFTEATGVEVRVDKESWEDIRPKAAVAANVGSGPDLMLVWFDDAHQYPDKLLDVTDVGEDLARRLGGYYPALEVYAKHNGKFVALPLASIGNGILYRESMLQQAGWSKFPEKTDEFLQLCKTLKAKSKPAGV